MNRGLEQKQIKRVVVTLATFRRPISLELLLTALSQQQPEAEFRVVVVDNDPAGSAREIVQRFGFDYRVEPRPGIVAARNTGLNAVEESDDAIVFIDDDEVPEPDWLQRLISHADKTGADVVSGPVISDIPDSAPRWVRAGGYLQRPRYATGTVLKYVATNNTLLRREAWESAGSQLFDDAFATSGGSDTAFFLALRTKTKKMEWCDEAVVVEEVPRSRLTWKWNWRRGRRVGGVMARIELADHPRSAIIASAIARVGFYTVRGLVFFPQSGVLRYKDFGGVSYNVGRIEACFDRNYQEYRRD